MRCGAAIDDDDDDDVGLAFLPTLGRTSRRGRGLGSALLGGRQRLTFPDSRPHATLPSAQFPSSDRACSWKLPYSSRDIAWSGASRAPRSAPGRTPSAATAGASPKT